MVAQVFNGREIAKIRELRERGWTPVAIASRFPGRTVAQVHRAIERAKYKLDKAQTEVMAVRIHHAGPIPPHVLADRERRMNTELTTHHILLGDPVVPRWMSNASR